MIRNNLQNVTSMKVHLSFFVLVTLIILLPDVTYGKSPYPDWFLHPEKYPELFVGYSIAGVLDAEDDAIWRYSFQKKGYLKGDATYFNYEDKWQKAYIAEASAPTLRKSQIRKIASIPTSLYGGGEEISLFKNLEFEFDELTHFSLDYPSNDRPVWVDKGPFYFKNDYYYGVGQYVLKGNENDAWRTAEERALIELASAIGINVSSRLTSRELRKKGSHDTKEFESINILTYTFDHEFIEAQVMQRWINYQDSDPDKNLRAYIYVLVRIKSGNIKHNLSSE